MTIPCNYYKRTSNLYNVVITSDKWDHEEATRTQGTITVDGKVVEWYLGEFHSAGTPIVIDGRDEIDGSPAAEILGALAERHCPEESDGRMHGDCPICAAKHELAVYEMVGILRELGLDNVKMARVNEDGT